MALRTGSRALETTGVSASMCCHPRAPSLARRDGTSAPMRDAQAEGFDRVEAAAELRHVTTLRVNRFFTHPSDRDPR